MFVMGGTNGGSGVTLGIDDVQVGRIDDSGVITWLTSDTEAGIDAMPQGRSFGGTAFYFTEHATILNSTDQWETYE